MSAQAEGLAAAPRRRLRENAVVHRAARLAAGDLRRRGAAASSILIAVLAPWIAPYGEHERVGDVFAHPSTSHWLGLDDGGFDMLSLMMFGARVSLIVGFSAALVAMLIGGAVGILAGYFGGRIDTLLMRITDYFLAIPDVPLMIVVAAVWGRSLRNIILIIGDHLLDEHGAGRARAGQERPRARLHPAHARDRRVEHAADHAPRAAAGGAAARRHRGADGRLRDLRRDRDRVPRPRRPEQDLLGPADRERVLARRRDGRRLVGDRAARHRGGDRRRQPDDARHRDRGRAQPAPARQPRLRAALPSAPRPAARTTHERAAGTRGAGPARLVRAARGPRAARRAGRRPDARARRAHGPRRRVWLRQDDAQPRADGPAAAQCERRGPRAAGRRGHPRRRRGHAATRTAGPTSR